MDNQKTMKLDVDLTDFETTINSMLLHKIGLDNLKGIYKKLELFSEKEQTIAKYGIWMLESIGYKIDYSKD